MRNSRVRVPLEVLMASTVSVISVGTAVDLPPLLAVTLKVRPDVLVPVGGLNVYDVLRRDTLVLTKAAVKAIQERLA